MFQTKASGNLSPMAHCAFHPVQCEGTTISGIPDLKRALRLLEHFDVEPFVCINMCDINIDNTEKINCFCKENSIKIAGRVGFSRKVTDARFNGKTVAEYAPESDVAKDIKNLWQEVRSFLNLLK